MIALFVALGGASYAAIKIPKNSVGSQQIKKNAVVSAKVKNRSLLAVDFRSGQLPRGATGAAGVDGAAGATGAAGVDGAAGATGAAGPTFSFSYSEMVEVAVSNNTIVVDNTISVPRAGRLVVNFSGRFGFPNGAPTGEVAAASCVFDVFPPGAPQTNVSRFASSGQATRAAGGFVDGSMPITFGYEVPAAGSYRFVLYCTKANISGTPTLNLMNYDMTGVLTGS